MPQGRSQKLPLMTAYHRLAEHVIESQHIMTFCIVVYVLSPGSRFSFPLSQVES